MRTYEVRTYGCQMNVHDSERLRGLLEDAGYVRAPEGDEADVVVFNTCAVRENADNKLYGNLGHLAPVKARKPGMQIAVGGCLAQKDKASITKKAPWVDVVFGTHNIGSLPVLLERARVAEESQVEILESLDVFPSTLPTRRESAYSAWVSVSVGCNNTCTFCIVPSLRGREKDRRPGDVLAEVEALVAEGVLEVTLLGQNVNSYGVEFGDRFAFGKLLRACGEIDGLERVRFTSPHPRDFTADVIEAMAETPNVMPSLHMPLQSGSDTVLKAMRRSYRRDRYLKIIEDVRAAMPDAAITTDIIVGFPGETEEDFQGTLDVVRQARFAGAFTFQYSKRPGTPAESMEDQVPRDVVQDRYERLVALQDEMAWDENKKMVGRTVEVLVAEGEGRKDATTHRLSGRARDNRLVHFALPTEVETPRPGDVVTVEVTYAAPHHLNADVFGAVRRTRAGDAWERAQDAPAGSAAAPGVMLGMPTVGAKLLEPATNGCQVG
ncbi:tRNA (N6-isopentenyl adenosine(37)-C2)-methylthiotransferase MiaB [Kribbella pratensis]|uniref:tRNA-2-methylthio-N(6)-dimethylallyladenosine synthase n=1 Tax=Kribbella pratensis TaxID=2512112 RepID=A0A4R8BK25_9ACTN|nr:tRNA (N6-isopentenyl adenosine(37)-C2)-methylthiotransferase MiaB [Kribbella pratensis]TDW54906.1 tRNA-i(6)A37 thiotransferase enzyme MiaB [Kribbella pratensis]